RAGFPAGRMEDEDLRAVPVVTDLAAGRFVLSDMLVAEQAVVGHARNSVTAPRVKRAPALPTDQYRVQTCSWPRSRRRTVRSSTTPTGEAVSRSCSATAGRSAPKRSRTRC